MGKIIGIDLGTTKCCVAVMQGGVPEVIPNQEGGRTTPSVVGFAADGQPHVGQVAKEHARTKPENTVSGVARLIGRRFGSPDVRQIQRFLSCRLVEGRDAAALVQIGDRVFSPGEILSFVLHRLKGVAEGYLGEPVEEAVITVPAYSGRAERHAIREACQMAGLKVSRVISGSTAAALTYAFGNPSSRGQFVAVCDLGGGTLDITILEMTEGLFQVRATSGDTYLGGEDFDYRIIDWLIGEFQGEMGIDLSQDGMALQRLKEAAEKAKCELSTEEKTEIALPFICADASGPKHLNTVLTRQKYEELTAELLEGAIDACERCLADAGLKPEQIDEVLLVGGQTRSPKVRQAIHKVFGRPMKRAADDGVVAKGAAIQTGIIHGEVRDLVLLDVTPHTLGIETKDGTFAPLIERSSTIPTRKARVFTTVADNQTRAEVHILEGESDMATHNLSLARFELTDIPPAPEGTPQIEVSLEIDINGTVSVSATDQATGRVQGMTIQAPGGPSAPERACGSGNGEAKSLVLLSVVPYTLGVETEDGSSSPMIARNSPLPARQTRVFTAIEDNQTRVEVHIFQGESDMAAYNKRLARLELADLEPLPKGVPRIELTIDVDRSGFISVAARDMVSDRVESTVIPSSPGVSLPSVDSTSALGSSTAKGTGIRLLELGASRFASSTEDDLKTTFDEAPRTLRDGREAATASPHQSFMTEDEALAYRMNTAEKLMAALKGSRQERAILICDPNPLVAIGVLGSPRLTEAEVESFSAMKNVSGRVLRHIGNHRAWTKRHAVINNLVRNPRTPIDVALSLVPRLAPRNIEDIAVDRSVPEALRRRARETAEGQWREYEAKARVEAVAVRRQLDGLVADTVRSVQALEGKLSADEEQRILEAIEAAKQIKARPDAALDDLQDALKEMEKAAAIIGQAMLRP